MQGESQLTILGTNFADVTLWPILQRIKKMAQTAGKGPYAPTILIDAKKSETSEGFLEQIVKVAKRGGLDIYTLRPEQAYDPKNVRGEMEENPELYEEIADPGLVEDVEEIIRKRYEMGIIKNQILKYYEGEILLITQPEFTGIFKLLAEEYQIGTEAENQDPNKPECRYWESFYTTFKDFKDTALTRDWVDRLYELITHGLGEDPDASPAEVMEAVFRDPALYMQYQERAEQVAATEKPSRQHQRGIAQYDLNRILQLRRQANTCRLPNRKNQEQFMP